MDWSVAGGSEKIVDFRGDENSAYFKAAAPGKVSLIARSSKYLSISSYIEVYIGGMGPFIDEKPLKELCSAEKTIEGHDVTVLKYESGIGRFYSSEHEHIVYKRCDTFIYSVPNIVPMRTTLEFWNKNITV